MTLCASPPLFVRTHHSHCLEICFSLTLEFPSGIPEVKFKREVKGVRNIMRRKKFSGILWAEINFQEYYKIFRNIMKFRRKFQEYYEKNVVSVLVSVFFTS